MIEIYSNLTPIHEYFHDSAQTSFKQEFQNNILSIYEILIQFSNQFLSEI